MESSNMDYFYLALPNAIQDLAEDSVDVVLEVCGDAKAVEHGIQCLRPGGMYILAGMVHLESRLNITGEQIIRKCLTLKGNQQPIYDLF